MRWLPGAGTDPSVGVSRLPSSPELRCRSLPRRAASPTLKAPPVLSMCRRDRSPGARLADTDTACYPARRRPCGVDPSPRCSSALRDELVSRPATVLLWASGNGVHRQGVSRVVFLATGKSPWLPQQPTCLSRRELTRQPLRRSLRQAVFWFPRKRSRQNTACTAEACRVRDAPMKGGDGRCLKKEGDST